MACRRVLRWKIIRLPIRSRYLTYTFLFKRSGECTFWAWNESVKEISQMGKPIKSLQDWVNRRENVSLVFASPLCSGACFHPIPAQPGHVLSARPSSLARECRAVFDTRRHSPPIPCSSFSSLRPLGLPDWALSSVGTIPPWALCSPV